MLRHVAPILSALIVTFVPGAALGTTFSQSACWDAMCQEEVAACQAHEVCTAIALCIHDGKSDWECFNTYGDVEAANLYKDIQKCGWASCAITDGTCEDKCGLYFGPDQCNCDDVCKQYGDCCIDYLLVCGKDADPPDCVPVCTGKQCGDDTCGGTCGTCPPGYGCDVAGLCYITCEDSCVLGDAGCDGDVQWLCVTGADGCTTTTTLDCGQGGMVCEAGACVAGPPPEDVSVSEEVTAPDAGPADTSGDPGLAPDGTNPPLEVTPDSKIASLRATTIPGSGGGGGSGCDGGGGAPPTWLGLLVFLLAWPARRRG